MFDNMDPFESMERRLERLNKQLEEYDKRIKKATKELLAREERVMTLNEEATWSRGWSLLPQRCIDTGVLIKPLHRAYFKVRYYRDLPNEKDWITAEAYTFRVLKGTDK